MSRGIWISVLLVAAGKVTAFMFLTALVAQQVSGLTAFGFWQSALTVALFGLVRDRIDLPGIIQARKQLDAANAAQADGLRPEDFRR